MPGARSPISIFEMATLLGWIQGTWLASVLAGSTWALPVLGAIHVLALAWFGASVLFPDSRLRTLKAVGLAILLATGILLFWSQPVRLYGSVFFRAKMILLLLILVSSSLKRIRIALWIAVIFVARGIAFY